MYNLFALKYAYDVLMEMRAMNTILGFVYLCAFFCHSFELFAVRKILCQHAYAWGKLLGITGRHINAGTSVILELGKYGWLTGVNNMSDQTHTVFI